MGKPSIFSNDYDQRMRKRRKMTIINTILIILILISGAYFGGSYYLGKEGIELGSIFKSFSEKYQEKQNIQKEDNEPEPDTDKQGSGNNDAKQPEVVKNAYYEYKTPEGKLYQLEYEEITGNREFTGVKDDGGEVEGDISADKKKIVFCTKSGDVIVGDVQGAIKKINPDSYKSKSSGITIEKKTTFKYYPEYVWAAKPHFTMDNRVVYITYLPYLKGANTFYMWAISIDGSSHRMVGKLSNDINRIAYDGFSSEGALRIRVNDSVLFLPSGSYSLTK